MRINKFLAECGVASRRNCDKLISDGLVTINGKIATLGAEVDELHDSVCVDGKKVNTVKKYSYFMMNKPKGYVCTVKDDKDRKTVMDLLPSNVGRVFPIGRLDYDSEGLLLFTNDGDLSNRLMHPSSEIPKTYLVKIDETRNFTKYHVTVTEGRNREIRKMFLTVNKEVKFLKRIKIGDLGLGSLNRGEVRKLTKEEVEYLKNV